MNPYVWPVTWFYLKGALYGLGSVATLYVTLLYLIPRTNLGRIIYFLVYTLFHGTNNGTNLTATSGGNPSLFGHLWFWLWSMIVFAGTFLIYLRLERA